jgi:hypothetical protein
MWKIFSITNDGIKILTNLFSKVKNKNEFPSDWKVAIICPIYKGKGSPREPVNYRGISLSSVLGKIFSGILAGRLRDWLSNHKVLSAFQAGFVKGKRTSDNVFIIRISVDKYLRVKRGKLYWCFDDFEKAFDSIKREALWFKMKMK